MNQMLSVLLGSYVAFSAHDAYKRFDRLNRNEIGSTFRFGVEQPIVTATCTGGCNVYSRLKKYKLYSNYPPSLKEIRDTDEYIVHSNFTLENIQIPLNETETRTVSKDKYSNFEFDFKNELSYSEYETKFSNSYSQFVKQSEKYDIPLDQFMLEFPMKCTRLVNDIKIPVFLNTDMKQITTNKNRLIRNIVAKRRMPLTITSIALLFLCFPS